MVRNRQPARQNRDWQGLILPATAQMVADGAANALAYTKRQLWYLLLSTATIVLAGSDNPKDVYGMFCRASAEWQRQDRMGRTIDLGRSIDQDLWFGDLADARAWLRDRYRLDRTEGQDVCLLLGAEKATMSLQLDDWFGALGLPRIVLRGYTSQSLIEDIKDHVAADGRPPVLIYAGDLDVDGFDIMADAVRRCGVKVVRVAINDIDIHGDADAGIPSLDGSSIDAKRPPKMKGGVLVDDPRRVKFRQAHGGYDRAIEIEAMAPADLRQRYLDAIDDFWDNDAYQRVIDRENEDRSSL